MSNEKSASAAERIIRSVEAPLPSGLRAAGRPLLEGATSPLSPAELRDDAGHRCGAPHLIHRDHHSLAGQEKIAPGPRTAFPDLQAQLSAVNLKKSYQKGPVVIPVLRGVDLAVREGEFLSIVGKSGSGKSTLLHLLATLDAPDEGEIYFDGQRIDNLTGLERDGLRNRYLGMIFQFYHLLPELTTLENVLSPLLISHSIWGYLRHRSQLRQKAMDLLNMVGLGHRLRHRPRELSGGEMQRAAIARALIAGPQVLLADEPTGNLDYGSGREILDLLRRLNAEQKLTIVMVTHDLSIAQLAHRTIELVQGRSEDPQDRVVQ